MPLYEYICECGHSFEAMLSVAEGAEVVGTACPKCGKASLRRVISAPAIHMRYSPMHPRHMRGQRGYKKKSKK